MRPREELFFIKPVAGRGTTLFGVVATEQDKALHLEIRDDIGSHGTILAEVTIRWEDVGQGYSNGQIVVDLADDGLTVEYPQFEVTMPGVVRMQLVGDIAKAVKEAEVCKG
jgi:hypothetical protein